MDETEILARLAQIVRHTLDDNRIVLVRSSEAGTIEGWDSIAHVHIMIAVEENFGIRFEGNELSNMPNIGALIDSIAAKLAMK
ncbi:MAG: acyl carrier protein [Stellaceae bacterium]